MFPSVSTENTVVVPTQAVGPPEILEETPCMEIWGELMSSFEVTEIVTVSPGFPKVVLALFEKIVASESSGKILSCMTAVVVAEEVLPAGSRAVTERVFDIFWLRDRF